MLLGQWIEIAMAYSMNTLHTITGYSLTNMYRGKYHISWYVLNRLFPLVQH